MTFYELKKQMLERKFRDIMPSYCRRASEIRPNLPTYSDDLLEQKLDDVVFKLKVLKIAIRNAQTKSELHRLRKMLDYSLAVKRFIRIEIKKRETLMKQVAELEIVEIDDADEQLPPTIDNDRKPTREEFEEMEREELRQIGLDLPSSTISVHQLEPVFVPELDAEFTDKATLFDPEIEINIPPTIYDCADYDMHYLDVLFSTDDTYVDPIAPTIPQSEKATTWTPSTTSSDSEENPQEPIAHENAYADGLIDYHLAIDVRTGEAFPMNKAGEQLYIGNDGKCYGINPYDIVRELKVKQRKYICFGANDLDLVRDRIYLSCVVGMNPYGVN